MLRKCTSARNFKQDFETSNSALLRKSTTDHVNLDLLSTYEIIKVMLIDVNDRVH